MGEGDKASGPASERPLAGIAANTASFAAASVGDAVAKLVVAAMPTAQTVAMRSLFVLLMFTPVFIITARRGLPVLATSRPGLHLIRFLLHLASTLAGFTALRHLPLTTFTTILFVAPMFVAVVAVPVLGERMKLHQIGAILLGFLGCLIILRPRGEGEAIFLLLALTSAATWAVSVVILRSMTRTESRVTIIAWGNLLLTITAGLLSFAEWRPLEPQILFLIAGMATAQIAGQWFSMTAVRIAPAATVAPAQYSQILWATIIGMLIFNERPEPAVWLGAAFIVAGGVWLLRSERWP